MRYVLLLYAREADRLRASEAEDEALHRDRQALLAEGAAAGRPRVLHALEPTGSATTVRVREGRALLCDGPFAETREQLQGVLFVDARDLDEAIAIAGRTPDARLGSVEIRPLRGAA